MPSTEEIQTIATQIALLPDGAAKLDRLLADERLRLDREERRIKAERDRLEAGALAEEARRVEEEEEKARTAEREAAEREADERARVIADIGRLAVELVAKIQSLGNGAGGGDPDVIAAIAPFVNRERSSSHQHLSAWVPSMILAAAARDAYGSDSRVIDAAIARIAALEQVAAKAGAQ